MNESKRYRVVDVDGESYVYTKNDLDSASAWVFKLGEKWLMQTLFGKGRDQFLHNARMFEEKIKELNSQAESVKLMLSDYEIRKDRSLGDRPFRCPRCANTHPAIEHGNKSHCPNCGLKFEVWGNMLRVSGMPPLLPIENDPVIEVGHTLVFPNRSFEIEKIVVHLVHLLGEDRHKVTLYGEWHIEEEDGSIRSVSGSVDLDDVYQDVHAIYRNEP